jgi:hypothetical protein
MLAVNGLHLRRNLMDKNRPVKVLRDGPVGIGIWLWSTPRGEFYDVAFSRSWNDEEIENKGCSDSFSDRHLDALIELAIDAKAWIEEQQAKSEKVAIAA